MGWDYYRREYYSRKGALENGAPELLRDPRIQHALAMIDIAERAIDSIAEEHFSFEEDD